jgi:hypothetical protein
MLAAILIQLIIAPQVDMNDGLEDVLRAGSQVFVSMRR